MTPDDDTPTPPLERWVITRHPNEPLEFVDTPLGAAYILAWLHVVHAVTPNGAPPTLYRWAAP